MFTIYDLHIAVNMNRTNSGRSPHFAGFRLPFTTSTYLGTRTRWMSIGAEVLSRNIRIFESKIAMWRYNWRFRRAFLNKMSPAVKTYCDYQGFFNLKIKPDMRDVLAKMSKISQHAGFLPRFRDGWHLWIYQHSKLVNLWLQCIEALFIFILYAVLASCLRTRTLCPWVSSGENRFTVFNRGLVFLRILPELVLCLPVIMRVASFGNTYCFV